MKQQELRKIKGLFCRLALVAVLLFGAFTIAGLAQGTLGLLPGAGLLLAELLALNTVCGLLLPAPAPAPAQLRAAARAVPTQYPPVLRVVRGGSDDGGRAA